MFFGIFDFQRCLEIHEFLLNFYHFQSDAAIFHFHCLMKSDWGGPIVVGWCAEFWYFGAGGCNEAEEVCRQLERVDVGRSRSQSAYEQDHVHVPRHFEPSCSCCIHGGCDVCGK